VFWADELAARVSGPQVINDSKTPSGTVHVGSLRGPVLLDVITRALRAAGLPTSLLYGIDDLDPMDAQALLTPDAVDRFMGMPLAHVPDPVGDCHPSYARHFASMFIDTFARIGVHPDRYYWMSEIYPTGQMDRYIRTALDRAELVREVYLRVSHVERPAGVPAEPLRRHDPTRPHRLRGGLEGLGASSKEPARRILRPPRRAATPKGGIRRSKRRSSSSTITCQTPP